MKQILIALAVGVASYFVLFSVDLLNDRNDWSRLVKEHESWVATGKQDLCNQLIQRLDQLEIEAGCRDKKFTEKDTVDQIFSCPIRVQQANPELVSRIESNGCSQPGWKLVFRSDRNHPGQFWEWRTLNNETQVSHFFEYSVFASLLVIIFFISINLWSREANPGWKRLSIVLSALATILSTWYATTEFGGLDRNIEIPLFTAISTYVGVLASRHIFKWVQDGFNSVSDPNVLAKYQSEEPTAPTIPSLKESSIRSEEPTFEFIEPTRANNWDRAFARCIDLAPALIVGSLLAEILPNPSLFINGVPGFFGDRIFWVLLNCLAIVGYDTLLLSTWGTTIGKSLFGIFIRTPEGAKLTAKKAYERSIQVAVKGLWLMLFFPWIQVAVGYSYIQKKSTPWDFTGRGWTYQNSIGKTRRVLSATVGITFILVVLITQKILKESARGDLLQLIL